MILAAIFLLLFSVALTFAPAGRQRTLDVELNWQHWLGYFIWLVATLLAHRQLAPKTARPRPLPASRGGADERLGFAHHLALIPGIRTAPEPAGSVWALASSPSGLRLPSSLAFLQRYKYVWLIAGLLLTALTVIFGTNPLGYGPRLWLGCCGIYLQPSEPLKLLLIAFLAAYLADVCQPDGCRSPAAAAHSLARRPRSS